MAAGRLDGAAVRDLRGARPDALLLVGGTDGGDTEVLTHNARRLAAARLRIPVVLAGNADSREPHPGPARAAIREVFPRHVIGG